MRHLRQLISTCIFSLACISVCSQADLIQMDNFNQGQFLPCPSELEKLGLRGKVKSIKGKVIQFKDDSLAPSKTSQLEYEIYFNLPGCRTNFKYKKDNEHYWSNVQQQLEPTSNLFRITHSQNKQTFRIDQYFFNSKGQVSKRLDISYGGIQPDTTTNLFTYSLTGKLLADSTFKSSKSSEDKLTEVHSWEYDSLDRLTFWSWNSFTWSDHRLHPQIIRYYYSLYSNQPYKTESISSYDPLNPQRLITYIAYDNANRKLSEVTDSFSCHHINDTSKSECIIKRDFVYDKDGKLIHKLEFRNGLLEYIETLNPLSDLVTNAVIYKNQVIRMDTYHYDITYDKTGNLLKKKTYKNGILVSTITNKIKYYD